MDIKGKKILIVQPNYKAGSEVWLERMTSLLEPHILAIFAYGPHESRWKDRIPVYDLYDQPVSFFCRVIRKITFSRIPCNRNAAAILKQYLQRADIVLVHFLGIALEFKELLIASGKPVFIHVHGIDITWDLRKINKPDERFYSEDYQERVQGLPRHFKFIANSEFSLQQLNDIGVSPGKIFLKYFGVPVNNINRTYQADSALQILYLGRLVDFKGPDLVIKAFELARSRGLKAQLMIAGDGPMRITCELQRFHSKWKEDILFIGEVDPESARQLFLSSDIFTMHNLKGPLTNQEEAFGVTIIEAMSFSLPVVTANSGAVSEIIDDNINGFLVESYNIEQHAEALIRLNKPEIRKRIGSAAQQHVKDNFSQEQELNSLVKIFSTAWDS
jgi:glycosyltransferase involved in cell wall biosynthesis